MIAGVETAEDAATLWLALLAGLKTHRPAVCVINDDELAMARSIVQLWPREEPRAILAQVEVERRSGKPPQRPVHAWGRFPATTRRGPFRPSGGLRRAPLMVFKGRSR